MANIISEHQEIDESGHNYDVFVFSDGKEVWVGEYGVSFRNGNASNVDYYYSEAGYSCSCRREVAEQYHNNFA